MNQDLWVFSVVVAALFVTYGFWLLATGRPFSRRGITRGDTGRLRRAPPIYFRAFGAVVATCGLTVLDILVLMDYRNGLPGWLVVTLQVVEGLLLVAATASTLWLLRLTNRYKLFRWNKP